MTMDRDDLTMLDRLGLDYDALDLFAGRIGGLYVKQGLSPPFRLRDAARHWLGISQDEIVAVIEKHFADYRRFYVSGSGDQLFSIVEAAIRKAWEAEHPPRDRADDEPVRPRPKRAGPRKVYTAGGYTDVIDDRDDGESIGEDAEVDA